MSGHAALELREVSKSFGPVQALSDVSVAFPAGAVTCLLGDNGAGKSTLIKILSGVHRPDSGALFVDGEEARFRSPSQALDLGIATVYQDLGLVPNLPVGRNFFLGREPTKGWGPFRRYDVRRVNEVTAAELARIGITLRSARRPVQVMSGGERQCLAIARAHYFGARVLILDEPTSALGVKEAEMVLRYIDETRKAGAAIVFITHQVRHAMAVADQFAVLNHGRHVGTYQRDELGEMELLELMAGGGTIRRFEAEHPEPEEEGEAVGEPATHDS